MGPTFRRRRRRRPTAGCGLFVIQRHGRGRDFVGGGGGDGGVAAETAGYVLASVLAAVCAVVTGNPAQEALRGGCDGEQRHAPWRDGPPFALKKCRFLPHWLFLPAPLVSWTRKQHTLLLLRATPQLQLSLALPPFVAFMAMWRQATGLSPSSEARI